MISLNDRRRRPGYRTRPALSIAVSFLLLSFIPACDSEDPVIVTPLPPNITISPATMDLMVGQTGQFHASFGAWPGQPSIEWTSSDDAIASVTQQGVATAIAPGEVSIIVTLVGTEVRAAARLVIQAPSRYP